jgi:DivIVA domain-containing protein
MSIPVDPGPVRQRAGALTAVQARSVTFWDSQLAWRGYSEDDVNEFVQRAAAVLELAERDHSALRAEIERLRNFYRDHGTDVDRAAEQSRPRRPGSRADAELLLLTRWMRRFGEAILAQVDAMVLVADSRLRSQVTWR